MNVEWERNCWGMNRPLLCLVQCSPNSYFQLFHGIRALALGKRSVGLCEVWSEYLVTSFLFGAVHRCGCILPPKNKK